MGSLLFFNHPNFIDGNLLQICIKLGGKRERKGLLVKAQMKDYHRIRITKYILFLLFMFQASHIAWTCMQYMSLRMFRLITNGRAKKVRGKLTGSFNTEACLAVEEVDGPLVCGHLLL